MKHNKAINQGFTLVEMSIVLTIISLIVAGVLSASSFIRTSRLKSVISEFQTFQTAANSFKQQYSYWPGDLPNATSIWASSSTQNGNGNGNIDYTIASNTSAIANIEPLRFWHHLTLSSILPNAYNSTLTTITNSYVTSYYYSTIGTNIPASNYQSLDRQGKSCWGVNGSYFYLAGLTLSNACATSAGNNCYINAIVPASDAVAPTDAYYIDNKIDDGYPSTGIVLSIQGTRDNAYNNSTLDCINGSSYKLSNSDRACLVSFYYW